MLDIGSNDGTQLKHFQALGYDVLGVESSKTTAQLANSAGVPTLNRFFNHEVARELGRRFDVINASGVFFHLEELHSVAEGIRECLRDDGIFVVQFLYMKKIIENLAFDQIYHEHLLYYNLTNIETLLRRHGLAFFDAHLAPIHGGSMIGFVSHLGKRRPSEHLLDLLDAEQSSGSNRIETYHDFARRVEDAKRRDLAYLDRAKQAGKHIFGMGAPGQGEHAPELLSNRPRPPRLSRRKKPAATRALLTRHAPEDRHGRRSRRATGCLLCPRLEFQERDSLEQRRPSGTGR